MTRQTVPKRRRRLRLGVYGGTFDPIHLGHLLLARDALEQLRLDAVMFVPCARSPFKNRTPHASDPQRVAMLRLALKGAPDFWLSRCELDRPEPSYAIDTALELRAAFPKAELFWLIGGDQVPDLGGWREFEKLHELVRFIQLPRGGGLQTGSSPVPGLPRPRQIDISATEIRRRLKSRLPIDHLVPATVAAYIQRHGLYRK